MKGDLMLKCTRLMSNIKLQVNKYSPEILVGIGIVGTITGTVMACKQTIKAKEIIDEKNRQMLMVNECIQTKSDQYSEEDAKKDTTIIYTQMGVKLVKLYLPAIATTTLSIVSILAGHVILKKRNIAIAAAYAVVDKGFKNYRKNVVERFGDEVDKELRYNIKAKEVTEEFDKDGKSIPKNKLKKKEQLYIDTKGLEELGISQYARFFDATSANFEKDSEYNMMFLRRQQDYANELLKARGHLFLNEVYDLLDITRSKAGQVVGWIYDPKNPKGDNYVDFGLYKNTEANRRFVNGLEQNVLLDFNVDGVIYDLI